MKEHDQSLIGWAGEWWNPWIYCDVIQDAIVGLFMGTALDGITRGLKSLPSDETPIQSPPERRSWMLDHQENRTLEESAKYVPYSTTKPKVEPWIPK
ncbi:putative NADH dehydrogenase ubiquinone 1 alpha subcomplex subunit 12 [Taenia crassiceps]|uniref:NADH dehydrogenase ubiquinone 1 alpha subcomplex subunit 12 n=1 Tax=Taenia crassiceps TaxID=6207 RepID=A0ABR4QR57_9CEST